MKYIIFNKLSFEEKEKLVLNTCDLNIIEMALKYNQRDIRYYAAKNLSLSKDKLKVLALSQDSHIREGVANNTNSNEEIINLLLKDNHYCIRFRAAQHHNLSENKLKELFHLNDNNNIDYAIFEGLSNNPNLNKEMLEILLKNKFSIIRYNAAKHINLPKNRIKELYRSNDRNIRKGIADNINTDKEILHHLSNDKVVDVKYSILANKNTSEKTLNNLYAEFPKEVLKHPNCPDYLKILSK